MLCSLELQYHHDELCKFLLQQYEEESLCDVLINTSDGKQLRAHTVVLAAFSEFFSRQIKLNHGRHSSMAFNVEHTFSCMRSLIDFMYRGKLNFNEEEKVQLYSAAVVLHITSAQTLLLESYSFRSLSSSRIPYRSLDTKNNSYDSDSCQDLSSNVQSGDQPQIKIKIKKLRKNSKPLRRVNPTLQTVLCDEITAKQERGQKSFSKIKIKVEKEDLDYIGENHHHGNHLDLEQDLGNDTDDKRSDPDYVLPRKKGKAIKIRQSKLSRSKVKLLRSDVGTGGKRYKNTHRIFFPCTLVKCSCHLCGKKFKSYNIMKRHRALLHNDFGMKNFIGQMIARRYILYTNFRRNFVERRKHQEKSFFWCNKCKKKFSYYGKACLHLRKLHFPFVPQRQNIFRSFIKFVSLKRKLYSSTFKNAVNIPMSNAETKLKKKAKVQCHLCSTSLSCDQQLSNHMIKIHKMAVEEAAILTGYPKYRKIADSDKSIQCLHCPEVFSSVRDLKSHNRQLHDLEDEVPPCGECGNTFVSMCRLKNHLRLKHHKTSEEIRDSLGVNITCEVHECKFSSQSAAIVNIHVQENHPGIQYKCSDCGYICYVKSVLDKHYITNHLSRERYLKIKCQMCDKRFSKRHHCRLHEYNKHGIHHPSIKIYKCDVEGCSYECISKQSLKAHEIKHCDEKKYECHFCGARLKTKTTYNKHVNKIHLGIRPHLCQVCGATFGDNSELTAHINNKHSSEKSFQCDYCTYSTSNKSTFYTHLFMVHKVRAQEDKRKEYQCTHCDFVTPLKGRYKTHMNGHKNIREHLCTECGKQFISRSTLVAHKQWTHSSKMYSCNQCEYRTKTVQKLNEHVRVQHQLRGLKPYRCPYCDFSCATGGNCRKHIKQKHKDEEVRYIRDDTLIAAARVARQAGNVTPLLCNEHAIDSTLSAGSSTVVIGDTSSQQMMFQLPAYGLDFGLKD